MRNPFRWRWIAMRGLSGTQWGERCFTEWGAKKAAKRLGPQAYVERIP